jgi:hypothetical protein
MSMRRLLIVYTVCYDIAMHYPILFAGFPTCTSAQEQQKIIAAIVAFVVFALACKAIFFLHKKLQNPHAGIGAKIALYAGLSVVVFVFCIVVPFFTLFVLSPWCT